MNNFTNLQPSKKSVSDEMINIANPAKTILNSLDIKITTKIGAEIILKKVNILGNIYLFVCEIVINFSRSII